MSMDKVLTLAQQRQAQILTELDNLRVLTWMHDDDDNEGQGKYDKKCEALNKELRETEAIIVEQQRIQGKEQNSKVVYSADLTGFSNAGTSATFAPQQQAGGRDYSQLDSGGFSCLGEFLMALNAKHRGEGFDSRLAALKVMAADLGTQQGSLGGFLIPPQFAVRAFTDHLQDTVLLQLCDREVMTGLTLTIPTMPDSDHSTTQPFGITWSQVPEGGDIDYSETRFGQLKLTARKSGALFTISNEMLRDAPNQVMRRVEEAFYKSLRWYIESMLWNGDGASQPLGVLVGSGTLSVPKQATQAVGSKTIVTENIVKMWSRLKPGSHWRSIWAANQTCFPQLSTMTINVGTGGTTTGVLDVNHSVVDAPATSIFGRPLYFSEHLPAVGTVGDICLLDPYEYLLGDRQEVTLDTSSHVKFASDQTVYRALARLDAQPKLSSVITPANGDTVAWCVKLATR